jgi:hypothetical protein
MDSVVQRLHLALAEALGRRRPDFETEPVTVAEVYQELVPYRSVRTTVGFEMNADYEHALLRLLSGEDGLVRLEPEEVRDELRRELATPNPDVTLFRRYAACDVWVYQPLATPGAAEEIGPPEPEQPTDWTPEWLEAAASEKLEHAGSRPWLDPEPEPEPPPAAAAPERAAEPSPADTPADAFAPSYSDLDGSAPAWADTAPQPLSLERDVSPGAPGRTGPGAAQCAFCRGALPADRPVRYCPFCGVDQQLRPCERCGEVLERGWRYCVTCGAAAPERAGSA